jgi:threonine dehydrogenase-like Zn-dependent dehydrogenase
MKALRLEEFGTMAVVDIPEPEAGAEEVVLAIIATGICGSDIHGFTGVNGRRQPGQIMGHESVGRIVARGAGVDAVSFPIGAVATFNPLVVPTASLSDYAGREQHAPDRRVIGVDPTRPAAFAERLVVPATNVVLLPDTVPAEWGALVEPLAVAVHAVDRVAVSDGEAVLVLGGGPIGQSVALAAMRVGARVVVSEPDADRRALCASLGATTIDPAAGPVADQVVTVFGGPADAALDAVGVSATVSDALESTRRGGRVGLVGMGSPRIELDAYALSTAERTIVGSFTYSSDAFRTAADWVATGDAVFAHLISEVVPLAEGPEAFRRLAAGGAAAGKILVRFGA